jgi:3-mercaptopyruvate sulfurtransferase SseA
MVRKTGIWISVVSMFFLLACSASKVSYKTPEQLISDAKAQIKEVSVQEVKRMIDAKENVILLDVRDKEEYDEEHLPGAINMSRGKLDFHIHELIPDKTARVIVH